jgi:hypothetical protein
MIQVKENAFIIQWVEYVFFQKMSSGMAEKVPASFQNMG